MARIKKFFRHMDFLLLAGVVLAAGVGLFAVNSATASLDNHSRYVVVQGAAALIGVAALFIVAFPDYDEFMRWRYFILGAAVFLLALVLVIGFGREDTGTQGWINMGFVNLQPSEIAKVCFIITLAAHISKIREDINSLRNVVFLVAHLCVYAGLILLQPDYGTAMVFMAIFLVMTFIAGLHLAYFAGALGLGAAAAVPVWFFVLEGFQRKRFLTFLNPESDPLGGGYHIIQSKIAVGSGQLFGKGYLQGTQTQYNYLPEKQNDFIFSVIGEELGFVGALLVTALLFFIIARCFMNGRGAKNAFGEMLCVGVGAMLLFHTLENIGMCLGLMPITGIPLPFISYGGSSLVTNFAAIGLVENVMRRRRIVNY